MSKLETNPETTPERRKPVSDEAACCSSSEQATCCEPAAKSSCCGPQAADAEQAPSRCGCR